SVNIIHDNAPARQLGGAGFEGLVSCAVFIRQKGSEFKAAVTDQILRLRDRPAGGRHNGRWIIWRLAMVCMGSRPIPNQPAAAKGAPGGVESGAQSRRYKKVVNRRATHKGSLPGRKCRRPRSEIGLPSVVDSCKAACRWWADGRRCGWWNRPPPPQCRNPSV